LSDNRLDEVLEFVDELIENIGTRKLLTVFPDDIKLLADAARSSKSARDRGFKEAIEKCATCCDTYDLPVGEPADLDAICSDLSRGMRSLSPDENPNG